MQLENALDPIVIILFPMISVWKLVHVWNALYWTEVTEFENRIWVKYDWKLSSPVFWTEVTPFPIMSSLEEEEVKTERPMFVIGLPIVKCVNGQSLKA